MPHQLACAAYTSHMRWNMQHAMQPACHMPPNAESALHARCKIEPPEDPHGMYDVQHAGCNMQHAGCNVQHAGCNMQHAGCNVQDATCNMQCFVCSLHVHAIARARNRKEQANVHARTQITIDGTSARAHTRTRTSASADAVRAPSAARLASCAAFSSLVSRQRRRLRRTLSVASMRLPGAAAARCSARSEAAAAPRPPAAR
jgi:hypothetical protein